MAPLELLSLLSAHPVPHDTVFLVMLKGSVSVLRRGGFMPPPGEVNSPLRKQTETRPAEVRTGKRTNFVIGSNLISVFTGILNRTG